MPNQRTRAAVNRRHRRTRALSHQYPRRPRTLNNDLFLNTVVGPDSPDTPTLQPIRMNALVPSLNNSTMTSPVQPIVHLSEASVAEQLERHKLRKQSEYEEDSEDFLPMSSDNSNLSNDRNNGSCDSTFMELEDNELEETDLEWLQDNCTNCTNAITTYPFTKNEMDDIITIKLQNSLNKFDKGTCLTRNDLVNQLFSDLRSNLSTPNVDPFIDSPSSVMAIWTTPSRANSKEELASGFTGHPTGKLVFKIPLCEIYVTLGSAKRLLHSFENDWYAVPLFGGKRRRIGNLLGVHGSSMNHGQVPGFVIHKLFTRNEIKSGVTGIDDRSDYPLSLYIHDSTQPLMDVIGYYTPNVYKHFYTSIIKELLTPLQW